VQLDRQDLLGDQAGCLIQALKAALTSGEPTSSVSVAFRCWVVSDGPGTAQTAHTRPRNDLGSLPRSLPSAIPSTWRSPTARTPVGGPLAAAGRPTHAPPTGGRVVAPPGGRRGGTGRHPVDLPARRGHYDKLFA
jgi:hypothetical protein